MDDMDDEDLSRFAVEEERVKPIDSDTPRPRRDDAEPPAEEKRHLAPEDPMKPHDPLQDRQTTSNPAPPLPGENPPPTEDDFLKAEKKFQSNEDFLRGEDEDPLPPTGPDTFDDSLQPTLEKTSVDNSIAISKNEQLDITETAPTMKTITIGAGWDQKAFEDVPVDIDLSLFLIDKNDMTRIDEDFIFYNNERACDGAVQHRGDSRTGAGDGDDESIFIDLNGVPFDILRIVIVLSVYDPDIKGGHLGMVKNMFLRIVNKDERTEVMRYRLDQEDHAGGNAMIVGVLIREGPKWIFDATTEVSHAGLAKIATEYGIIVKELQTTGEETWGEETEQPPAATEAEDTP